MDHRRRCRHRHRHHRYRHRHRHRHRHRSCLSREEAPSQEDRLRPRRHCHPKHVAQSECECKCECKCDCECEHYEHQAKTNDIHTDMQANANANANEPVPLLVGGRSFFCHAQRQQQQDQRRQRRNRLREHNNHEQQQQQHNDSYDDSSSSSSYDDELLLMQHQQQQQQRRYLWHRRLIIRPAVVLLLGLFVFRNNNIQFHNNNSSSNNNNKNITANRKNLRFFWNLFGGGTGTGTGTSSYARSNSMDQSNPPIMMRGQQQQLQHDHPRHQHQHQHQHPNQHQHQQATIDNDETNDHDEYYHFLSKNVVGMKATARTTSEGEEKSSSSSSLTLTEDHLRHGDKGYNEGAGAGKSSPGDKATASSYPFVNGWFSIARYNAVTVDNKDNNNIDANADVDADDASNENESSSTSDGNSNGNGMNDNNNNNDDDNSNNSDDYGWAPETYPDPWIDPVRCGIAFLTVDELQNQKQQPLAITNQTSTNQDTSIDGNGNVNGRENDNADTGKEIAGAGLRLCDPDWVLGVVYLEQIAQKMHDFSDRFTTAAGTINGVGGNADGNYNSNGDADADGNKNGDKSPEKPERGISLAVATVRKMNIHAVLRQQQMFYSYGDDDDMVNDAAQIFARSLHNQWWENRKRGTPGNNGVDEPDAAQQEESFFRGRGHYANKSDAVNKNNNYNRDFGVLIFLSIQDRVCFISTGDAISNVLPWWRLEHIVASMKPDLRHRDYGNSILTAIDELSEILEAGPPTLQDRIHDFLARFGVVIAFALFTFVFGAWGESRDRRKRWQYAELRSQLNAVEREKARLKQKQFQNKSCPICLEPLTGEEEDEETVVTDEETSDNNNHGKSPSESNGMVRVDSYGIPLLGADRKGIKLLRCGHIFCESCWKSWVHSGHGNPCICPVCRQDVGKSSSKSKQRKEERRAARRARAISATNSGIATALGMEEEITPMLASENNTLGSSRSSTGNESASAYPSYGSLFSPAALDTTALGTTTTTSEPTSFGTTSTIADSIDGGVDIVDADDENALFTRGVNLWASTFGPRRNSATMNRDRSRIQAGGDETIEEQYGSA